MEDAEKIPNDAGNNIQESESKVFVAKVESEGENFPHAAAVSGDVNKRENGGEYLCNGSRNEDEDKTTVKTEVKDQTDPKSEATEPIEGSVLEQINSKTENEELINTKNDSEEQTAPRSGVEKQTDAKTEVVEQNATSSAVKEEKLTANIREDGNHVQIVDEKPNEDIAEKKPIVISKDYTDCVQHVAGGEKIIEKADPVNDLQLPTELSVYRAPPQRQNAELDGFPQGEDEEMEEATNLDEDKKMKEATNLDEDKTVKDGLVEQGAETVLASCETNGNSKTVGTAAKHDGDSSLANQHEAATPSSLARYCPAKAGDHGGETVKTVLTQATLPPMGEGDDGTPEDQAAFMNEVESFYRERAMDFKPPKFYGQPLNCLKLWRAVIKLGGYDRVTGAKLWRQVGESFHPPKTCTTVSWTFRIFYEKSLLEYERHKTQSGELQLPAAALLEASGVDGEGNGYQGSGSGRGRKDAAARATQGWHAQRLVGNGEDKNLNNMAKREKNLKSIGLPKQKRPNEVEHSNKAARTETPNQLETSVVDVGPPADWVKINIRQTEDCFEVYALVPGLLREEVRVQSDPAGRLVITGQPEQVDNPWGITAFKKVVNLPARIDPLQTSAVVSLHGRLYVRIPFEQSNVKI